jgi:hypothetical protein
MNFTPAHARAIIDMDNLSYSRGLEPAKNNEAWEELVRAAEEMIWCKSNLTNFLESKGISRWDNKRKR